MQRLATVTVIRGNGACEAYMNGIVQEEIEKMKEQHAKELCALESELEARTYKRDKLLYEKRSKLRASNARSVSRLDRLKERIVIIWCQIYGLGEAFKLWKYEGK